MWTMRNLLAHGPSGNPNWAAPEQPRRVTFRTACLVIRFCSKILHTWEDLRGINPCSHEVIWNTVLFIHEDVIPVGQIIYTIDTSSEHAIRPNITAGSLALLLLVQQVSESRICQGIGYLKWDFCWFSTHLFISTYLLNSWHCFPTHCEDLKISHIFIGL
jgi:hypothetical protein